MDADPQSSLTRGLLGPEALDSIDPTEPIAAVLRGEDPSPDSGRPTKGSGTCCA